MRSTKERLQSLIQEIKDLEHHLESLRETQSVLAKELLDSVRSDSYSMSSYTIYRKAFYKILVKDQTLAKEYMIPEIVLDKKSLIKEFEQNKRVKGFKIIKEVKVLVRTRNEI